MDQQKQNPNPPAHVPTEAEIARLEAQRGEPIPRREAPARAGSPEPEARPEKPNFVPYVDDVPDPEPPRPAPKAEAAQAAEDDGDDDDEPYIPSEWEKRIDALTPKQWKMWQIAGGAFIGLAVIAALFLLGQEMSAYALILAAVLAILLPRYLERAWRRKLNTARYAMIVAMAVGLVVLFLVNGFRTGFHFTTPK